MTDVPNEGIICLPPGAGRRYAMGRLTAIFKADGVETGEQYSASEWHLDPGQPGVGAHRHEANDEIFLILDGCPDFLLEETWTACPAGTFLRIPAGVLHDFAMPGLYPPSSSACFLVTGSSATCPAL